MALRIGNLIARKYRKKRRKLAKMQDRIARRQNSTGVNMRKAKPTDRIVLAILNRLLKENRILPLATYADGSQPIAVLADAAESISEAPRLLDAEPIRHLGTMPAIAARLFTVASVSGNSSAVAIKDRICVPDLYVGRPELQITDASFFVSQADSVGTVYCADPRKLPKGIAVFGSGASNWYHWLIEILPAAFLAEGLPKDYSDFPLIVPEECLAVKSYRDSLAVFSGGRAVITQPIAAPMTVDKLIWIDSVASGPMNLASGHWPVPSDYRQHAPVLRRYRAAIMDRLGIGETSPSRRMFLARDQSRRSYNQEELLAAATRYGFEPVFPEQLSFREQVELFSSAEFVIGPSGAAFANMLFCQPGTRGLTWLVPSYRGFCAYSDLAQVIGMRLVYLFTKPEVHIANTHDAYIAPYQLDPVEFERALKAMA